MARVGMHVQLCMRDLLTHEPTVRRRDQGILIAIGHQHRQVQLIQTRLRAPMVWVLVGPVLPRRVDLALHGLSGREERALLSTALWRTLVKPSAVGVRRGL